MKDSDGVSDDVGEWFEVTNVTDADIDMQGMVIKDAGTDSHTIAESVIVTPGKFVVWRSLRTSAAQGSRTTSGIPTSSA